MNTEKKKKRNTHKPRNKGEKAPNRIWPHNTATELYTFKNDLQPAFCYCLPQRQENIMQLRDTSMGSILKQAILQGKHMHYKHTYSTCFSHPLYLLRRLDLC